MMQNAEAVAPGRPSVRPTPRLISALKTMPCSVAPGVPPLSPVGIATRSAAKRTACLPMRRLLLAGRPRQRRGEVVEISVCRSSRSSC